MYINPLHAIQEGWIVIPSWMDDEFKQRCIQPNAIDVTLDRAFAIQDNHTFMLSEEFKQTRHTVEIYPQDTSGFFQIESGPTDILSDFYVNIPTGVAAFLIVRSTLNRNGLFVTSGLYDSGYTGHVGMVIHNDGPVAFIEPHTRIAQLVLVKSEDSGLLYSGGYNHEQGTHWTEKSH